MRNFILSSLALGFLALPGVASADEVRDRTQAIQLCRAEVASQAGVELAQARFDQVRVRPHAVRVDIDLWRNGQLQNIRCEVARGGEQLTIASITPALTTATASIR